MRNNKQGKAMIIAIVVLVILLILTVSVGVYFWLQSNNIKNESNNNTTTKQESIVPKLVIEPLDGNTASGVITVTLENAPEETKMVAFVITGEGEDVSNAGPNLGYDTNSSDGWSKLIDTSSYDNGLFEISGLPTTSAEANPLSLVSSQILIKN